jgi:hypothetical protein
MIKIKPSMELMEKFLNEFPKSQKVFDKYFETIEFLINKHIDMSNNMDNMFKTYPLPLHDIKRNGGRVGSSKQYVDSWFRNTAPVYNISEKGSNLTSQISKVSFTKNVIVDDDTDALLKKKLPIAVEKTIEVDNVIIELSQESINQRELDILLSDDRALIKSLIKQYFPDLLVKKNINDDYIIAHYDMLPVDEKSLRAYIDWLVNKADIIKESKKKTYLRNARLILNISKHTNGWFPQRKKHSEFGRTYYSGISVQSINKELRRAVLGNCHEYDIRSSAIAFKLVFAKDAIIKHGLKHNIRDAFPHLTRYLERKIDTTQEIIDETFEGSTIPEYEWKGKIKECITAIGFGARFGKNVTYFNTAGEQVHGSISEILDNEIARANFYNCKFVIGLVSEMKILDDTMYELFMEDNDLIQLPFLKLPSGRVSKSKVLSYIYQQYETIYMKETKDYVESRGYTIIASIHDAFITREKLSFDDYYEIILRLQEKYSKWFNIGHKPYEAYRNNVNEEYDITVQLHRAHMAEEYKKLRNWVPQSDFIKNMIIQNSIPVVNKNNVYIESIINARTPNYVSKADMKAMELMEELMNKIESQYV